MLELNINVNYDDCNCQVVFEDVTGFASQGFDNGFLSESEQPTDNKSFRLSDGVFYNILYLKNLDDTITLINTTQLPIVLQPSDVKDNYEENVRVEMEELNKDGRVYITRHFIITKQYYNSNSALFNGDTIYYDEDDGLLYYNGSGSFEVITEKELVTDVISDLTLGISSVRRVLFNLCMLKKCYRNMLESQFDNLLGVNPLKGSKGCFKGNCNEDQEFIKNTNDLNLIRNALTAIEYLLDCGKYDDAMRLLHLLGNCGGICYKYNKKGRYGCGC